MAREGAVMLDATPPTAPEGGRAAVRVARAAEAAAGVPEEGAPRAPRAAAAARFCVRV